MADGLGVSWNATVCALDGLCDPVLSFLHFPFCAHETIPADTDSKLFRDLRRALLPELCVFEMRWQGGETLAYDAAQFCLCRACHALHLRGLEAEVSPVREGSVWGQMTFVGDFT